MIVIVQYPSPASGVATNDPNYWGPFDSEEAALAWGERKNFWDWFVADLMDPKTY